MSICKICIMVEILGSPKVKLPYTSHSKTLQSAIIIVTRSFMFNKGTISNKYANVWLGELA